MHIGVTAIGGCLMERNFRRGVSGTAMTVQLIFGGGPTTVNIMAVNDLHHITNHSFISLKLFDF